MLSTLQVRLPVVCDRKRRVRLEVDKIIFTVEATEYFSSLQQDLGCCWICDRHLFQPAAGRYLLSPRHPLLADLAFYLWLTWPSY